MGRVLGAGAPAHPAPPAGSDRRLLRVVLALAILECVANVSEGRDPRALTALSEACGGLLLDLHADPDHHRSVFTLAGTADDVLDAARSLARAAVSALDLFGHEGAHPRLGVLDVVPFVPLTPPGHLDRAVVARDAFGAWLAGAMGVPCFAYGPLPGGTVRSLPEVRRGAFGMLAPDWGPADPHPTAGATAVGARSVLVAYNLWVTGADATLARSVAAALRGPAVRALGFDLASGVQISCNLIDPYVVGPAQVVDAATALLRPARARVARCELVGLLPASVLEAAPRHRWAELDLGTDRTIEARLEAVSRRRRRHPD
jgi:glutamate formiminotransferase